MPSASKWLGRGKRGPWPKGGAPITATVQAGPHKTAAFFQVGAKSYGTAHPP